ncbi:uncharacterized protein MONBRDRAFT_30924 [Monosiga brevicollis MX1]|uniref:SH2 domain-containing protein n=1 Tax=Monosiga brevicollis TaxID=81824 RepID=A9UQ77_MONBE|nr:uncharacterized protein MONBRDRAFT_30924 [Monosiga brevicollis MX1]EDQ92548.1 predicted protein [Monosiga brevicollis MX1]|eukprot:XP_001742310.1 hypothetical protein [Monosiga brevicollis MX1]
MSEASNPMFDEKNNLSAAVHTSGDLYDGADGVDPFGDVMDTLDFDFKALEMMADQAQPENDSYLSVQPDGQWKGDRRPEATEESGYLAVQPEWLEGQWELLSSQPWFRGSDDYRRDDATRELAGQEAGAFVVRISFSQPGHYAISAKTSENKIVSMLILPTWAGPNSNAPGQTQYRLGSQSKLLFNTVPKLIKYYTENPYYHGNRLKGDVRPEQQEGGYIDVTPVDVDPTKPASGDAGATDAGYLDM